MNYDCYSCFSAHKHFQIPFRRTDITHNNGKPKFLQTTKTFRTMEQQVTTRSFSLSLSMSLNYRLSSTNKKPFFKNLSVHNDHGVQQTPGTNSRCLIKLARVVNGILKKRREAKLLLVPALRFEKNLKLSSYLNVSNQFVETIFTHPSYI